MRMMMIAGSAALAVSLGACGGGTPAENVQQIEVPEGEYEQRLRDMPEGQRNATFIRAIRDAGRECQNVTSSSYVGETNGAPTWTATCERGQQWTIMLGRDGIVQIVDSAELQAAPGVTPPEG